MCFFPGMEGGREREGRRERGNKVMIGKCFYIPEIHLKT